MASEGTNNVEVPEEWERSAALRELVVIARDLPDVDDLEARLRRLTCAQKRVVICALEGVTAR